MSDKTEFNDMPSAPPEDEDIEKQPCLIMIEGDFIGKIYALKNEITIIGRDEDAAIVLDDTQISRRHAMIECRVDGFYFSDLDSTNGCLHNRLNVHEPIKLNEGDKLALGSSIFKFGYQDEDDAKYHSKLRDMAVRDELTGIYNKRYFNDSLEKEFAFCKRNSVSLALVIFDVDDFKAVNDNWGHPAGDYTLQRLAQLVNKKTRGYDVFARYGGEEFIFLLKGETLQSTIAFAESVRVEVEGHDFFYDARKLNISISLGVAWWDGIDESTNDAEQLIEVADKYLYKAKEDGRNCVRHDSN